MANLNIKSIGERAESAAACSYCFLAERGREWGHVPSRPSDRPNDVALVPWVGAHYARSSPRIAVVMLNPGHAPASHKLARRDLGIALNEKKISYAQYNQRITPLIPRWGFGAIVRWLGALGIESERIAFMNVALCAVADDKYFPELFESCFRRHTLGLISELQPSVVLLCGKKELAPFAHRIESVGPKVILTWHYRPMHTAGGKKELGRVRALLDAMTR